MLRQNRSEGSSTSPSFAKTALSRARRKTFQFSDEQFTRHIFITEPLFLIPSVQTEVQESGSIRGAILFSKEPLFLMPPGRARSPRGSQGSRVRKGTAALFSREPLCLIPLGFTDAPLAASLSSSSFSSPSLQGGSGIPAVPKTGASVLRLLPPTS